MPIANGKSVLSELQTNYKSSLVSKNRVDSSIRNWIKTYNGEKYGNEVKGRSAIVMKDVKKAVKAMAPSICEPFLVSDNLINAKPVRVGMEAQAAYEADILNYQFNNEFDKIEFFTSLATILPKEGTVFVRTGWEFKQENKKRTLKNVNEDMVVQLHRAGAKQIRNIISNQDGSFNVTIEKTTTVVNKPTARICKNESITTDPTAETFKESKFITHEYEKSISDLKKEKHVYDYQEITDDLVQKAIASRYPETALGGQRAMDNYHSGVDYSFNFEDNGSKKVRIIEYWGEYDLDGTGINQQIVCAWIKGTDFILRLDKNPYPDGAIPFVSCQFGFEPFTLWGSGVADAIGDNQQIHTAIMRGFIDNMSLSNNGQKFFQKGSIDYVNMGKLARGEKFIEMNDINGLKDGSYNQLPPSSFQVYDMISAENDMLTGTSKNMDGIDQATIGRTAAGVNQVMSAAQRHMVLIVRTINDMLKDMFNKWSAYNSEFLDDEQAFEIAGTLVPIDKSQVTGDIRIELNVNVDSMNSAKIQQINMLLQQSEQLGQYVPPNTIPALVAEIFEGFGRYEKAKEIREYQPQPDPMQQAMQQLELAERQALVDKMNAETEKLRAETEVARQMAVHTASKAIESQAMSDNLDMQTIANKNDMLLKEADFRHNAIQDYLERQTESVKS